VMFARDVKVCVASGNEVPETVWRAVEICTSTVNLIPWRSPAALILSRILEKQTIIKKKG
jgi:hypothetical protein